MGRRLLLTHVPAAPGALVAAGWVLMMAGCAAGPENPAEAGGDPHATLACAECHDGGLADRSLAAVPPSTCTGSGCHAENVPGESMVGSVRFTHADHGSTETLSVGCAGCHTHETGDEPLQAGPETCGLCHREELSGEEAEDCRLCHESPTHSGVTSQGVAIPHEGLPWIEGGCLRCHYEVTHPVHEVPLERCTSCHTGVDELAETAVGENLHPRHNGIACTSCHESDNHRIESMSSAVDLQCATCHLEEHDVEVRAAGLTSASCNQCHGDTHQAPQELLLGVAFEDAQPSPHFSQGLTCGSCHLEPDGTAAENRPAGTGDACVDCHRPEYRSVLRWWEAGVADRTRLVNRYLTGAENALGEDNAELAEARSLLMLVRDGNGEHNLPLTHRLFQETLERTRAAYREAGRTPPPAPTLGRDPRPGLCSYCHYRVDEPGMSEEMDDTFHREVMGR